MERNREVKKVALAADHRGFEMKGKLVLFLKARGIEVQDFGTDSEESSDYPDFILKAAEAVGGGRFERAIGICHSGIGSSIAANKVKGVRAALVQNEEQARLSREHNDSNMLILGSGYVGPDQAKKIVEVWLQTRFVEGRHARRIDKITRYEKEH